MEINKPRILVILGPTAVGKSNLAVEVARLYNGEVISADSRQVYKGLDIGTGKITEKEMRGVPHHLLDVVDPKKIYSVELWKKHTDQTIKEILSRGKLPIICGGTGFYIQSIVDNITLPDVPTDNNLRKKLSTKTPEQLFTMLKKLDFKRAKNIDPKNPVRLVRAIEIATALGSVPKAKKVASEYEFIQIGLTLPIVSLREKINIRLLSRIKNGMVKEAKSLHDKGLSYRRMEALGLEYRHLARYLQNKIDKKKMVERLNFEIGQYARRQMQWFKRDARIKWFEPTDTQEIISFIDTFLS